MKLSFAKQMDLRTLRGSKTTNPPKPLSFMESSWTKSFAFSKQPRQDSSSKAPKKARSSLLGFTQYTFPQYKAEPAHELIASKLDEVVQGKLRRLMIWAPPQHGKSELTSVRLPPFWLGNHPDEPLVLASYGASLAEGNSRQARQIVESEEFQVVFPGLHTNPASRAVDRWQLEGRRGHCLAVGVGGPITGKGVRLGIVDDPHKDWAEAQSKTVRESVWEWYRKTFRTRVWEGGAIVIIMTRWHEDDLCGKLLKDQPDQWEVLRLPAVAEPQEVRDRNHEYLGIAVGEPDPLGREPDEPLCPGRYSREALAELERDVGSLGWAAEYQGIPRAAEGNRIKREWLRVVRNAPAAGLRVRYWDKAGTDGGGAYTAGVLMLVTPERQFYVEDVVRGQWSALERERIILETADMDKARWGRVAQWFEQEPGSGGKESAENTVRSLAGFDVHAERVTGSKEVRAEPFIAQCEAQNVFLVQGAWNADYIEEAIVWPYGKLRDQVDASGGAFNKLAGVNQVKGQELLKGLAVPMMAKTANAKW